MIRLRRGNVPAARGDVRARARTRSRRRRRRSTPPAVRGRADGRSPWPGSDDRHGRATGADAPPRARRRRCRPPAPTRRSPRRPPGRRRSGRRCAGPASVARRVPTTATAGLARQRGRVAEHVQHVRRHLDRRPAGSGRPAPRWSRSRRPSASIRRRVAPACSAGLGDRRGQVDRQPARRALPGGPGLVERSSPPVARSRPATRPREDRPTGPVARRAAPRTRPVRGRGPRPGRPRRRVHRAAAASAPSRMIRGAALRPPATSGPASVPRRARQPTSAAARRRSAGRNQAASSRWASLRPSTPRPGRRSCARPEAAARCRVRSPARARRDRRRAARWPGSGGTLRAGPAGEPGR